MIRTLASLLVLCGAYAPAARAQIDVSGSCLAGAVTLGPAGTVGDKPAYQGTGTFEGMAGVPLEVFWSAVDMVWVFGSNGGVFGFNPADTPEPPFGSAAEGWQNFYTCASVPEAPLTVADAAAMPVELLGFSAHATGRDVVLRWSTASERDNRGFGVERAGATVADWREIAFVPGAGTAAGPLDYVTTDRGPATGTQFYRLRQVDLDGRATYSDVVAVEVAGPGEAFRVGPNPSPGAFAITGPAAEGRLEVRATDGRLVYAAPAQRSGELVAVGQLSPGHYLVVFAPAGAAPVQLPLVIAR